MNKPNSDYADPFFGNGVSEPAAGGKLAPTWFFIKPQSGNTTPAASVPFGLVSACAYSGGYPTGYGTHDLNYHSRPRHFHERPVAAGFTHFHVSGTGAIEHYYNYFRVIPSCQSPVDAWRLWEIADESARPGYYAATLKEPGIRAEMTSGGKCSLHRYTFPAGSRAAVAIDFATASLKGANVAPTRPAQAGLRLVSESLAEGWVEMKGVKIYLHAEIPSAVGSRLWIEGREAEGRERSYTRGQHLPESFGVVFDLGESREGHVRLGFSLRSCEQARANLESLAGKSFDEAVQQAADAWAAAFDLIEVSGGSERERTAFYSSFYHTLVKPMEANGESPFYTVPHDYYTDLATLWDQYKTQLPLVFSLMPERGSAIIRSLLAIGEYAGEFPNAILLSDDWSRCSQQARALAHYVIADGFYRHLKGVDWSYALELMVRDIRKAQNTDFLERGEAEPATHTLDLAGACHCIADIAESLGQDALADEMRELSGSWRSVFDPQTARLKESTYYEGGQWNYSFRLLPDMASRIALYPTEEDFVADLERFFGYGQEPVTQPFDPEDSEYAERGVALNRFEGLNNEPDMEAPYAFIYAGRHDRTAEVVREAMKYQFTTGRGGLPGNNDSGGLTSWYLWSASGLFPVAGQPLILIGSPIFDSVIWNLGGAKLVIRTENNSPAHIYVQSAVWNGATHDRAYLTMEEFLGGGELILKMGPVPGGWARENRPCAATGNRLCETLKL